MRPVLVASVAAILFLAGCAAQESFTAVEAADISLDSEGRLHQRSDEETGILDGSGQLYADRQLDNYLNSISRKLLPSGYDGHPITVKVIKNPWLGAFAFPNGRIYFHTGMLAAMDNEAQLAAIMGHEMSHVLQRHLARQFTSLKKKSAEEAGSLRKILNSTNCYSRQLETEADREGLRMMVQAGYDPREALKVFELLRREIEEEKIKERRARGDHPVIQERIHNTASLVQREYAAVVGVTNSEAFSRATTRLLIENADLDLKRGNFRAAQHAIEKYLASEPRDATAYYLLGEINREGAKSGEDAARASYAMAISLFQNYAEPYRGLGLLDCRQGNKGEARKNLQRYLELKPEAADREHIKAYMNGCR